MQSHTKSRQPPPSHTKPHKVTTNHTNLCQPVNHATPSHNKTIPTCKPIVTKSHQATLSHTKQHQTSPSHTKLHQATPQQATASCKPRHTKPYQPVNQDSSSHTKLHSHTTPIKHWHHATPAIQFIWFKFGKCRLAYLLVGF